MQREIGGRDASAVSPVAGEGAAPTGGNLTSEPTESGSARGKLEAGGTEPEGAIALEVLHLEALSDNPFSPKVNTEDYGYRTDNKELRKYPKP